MPPPLNTPGAFGQLARPRRRAAALSPAGPIASSLTKPPDSSPGPHPSHCPDPHPGLYLATAPTDGALHAHCTHAAHALALCTRTCTVHAPCTGARRNLRALTAIAYATPPDWSEQDEGCLRLGSIGQIDTGRPGSQRRARSSHGVTGRFRSPPACAWQPSGPQEARGHNKAPGAIRL